MDPGNVTQESLLAYGSVTGGTGATLALRGDVAVARSGAGVYTLTAGNPVFVAGFCSCGLTLRGNSGIIRYAVTSTTVITVSSFAVDGTTATDKDFDFRLVTYLPNN